MLNIKKLQQFQNSKGWSDRRTASEIGIEVSYFYRVIHKQRGVGKKFILGLMNLCIREGLDIYDFIIPKNEEEEDSSMSDFSVSGCISLIMGK